MFIKWVTTQFNSLTDKVSMLASQSKDQNFNDHESQMKNQQRQLRDANLTAKD